MTATHEARREGGRYSAVSIVLHWTLAALIVTQIFVGGWFEDLDGGPEKREAFALHLSFGVTILALSLVRLFWRLANPAPPLPDHMARWEKLLARTTHVLFYVFMIGMPVTGWLTISAGGGSGRPLELWGTIPWFRIPGVPEDAHDFFEDAHTGLLLKSFWFILALHVAGALKHHFIQRDEVLWRMLPIVGRPRNGR
jgi:cytochrome b561